MPTIIRLSENRLFSVYMEPAAAFVGSKFYIMLEGLNDNDRIVAEIINSISHTYLGDFAKDFLQENAAGDNESIVFYDKEKDEVLFYFAFNETNAGIKEYGFLSYIETIDLFRQYYNALRNFVEKHFPKLKEGEWYNKRFLTSLAQLDEKWSQRSMGKLTD